MKAIFLKDIRDNIGNDTLDLSEESTMNFFSDYRVIYRF